MGDKHVKVLFSWSGGKDSALALYSILSDPAYEVAALLTTVTEEYDRISMHGVRRVLLERQAAVSGLPLEKVFIPRNASNEVYEARMASVLTRCQAEGVTAVVFGDIFLEDLRKYREDNLARLRLKAVFPLWKRDTKELIQTFVQAGFRAVTTCVDTQALGQEYVGREIDGSFVAELPATVDPCGENGEYHSFVYAGPIFQESIPVRTGEKVLRENRFYYCDLIPADGLS
jgi:uncharacterized protein (TIGR00290 family)